MRIPILFLFLFGTLLSANAQSRAGKDRALLFAVNNYQKMSALNNPIQNARDIAAELQKRYGFETEVVPNPTFAQIEAKIKAYQQAYQSGRYPQDGQLFIFFSGHGVKRGNNGYFMPADADPDRPYALGLEYDFWRSEINDIDCKHILVAVDACYSISFDPRWQNRPDRQFYRSGEQFADQILLNHQQYRARLYFTSDAEGDMTPDRSTFARQLLAGLRTYQSATGYLTSSVLFSNYLQQASPTPGGGDFGSDNPGSCFLFFNQLSGNPADARADLAAWLQARQENTAAAYRRYLAEYLAGEFRPLAQQQLNKLEAEEQELRAWESAKTANTREAYQTFITAYPNSAYRELAELNRDKLQPPVVSTEPKRPPDNMVFVQGGSFQMGSTEGDDSEKPVHTVTLSDYYIGRFEVTVEDFSRFVQVTNYETDAEKGDGSNFWENPKWVNKPGINWRHDATGKIRPAGEYKHPVIHVSWNDAVAYCNWLSEQHQYQPVYTIKGDQITANWNANGYRLPTEAEWEFAARSRGKSDKWAGTSSEKDLASFGNYWENGADDKDGYKYTAPVGSFQTNALGLHDMSGNVWEWCWDWFDFYPSTAQTNPKGPDFSFGRIARGGSWYFDPTTLRCAFRAHYGDQHNRFYHIGFRLSRSGR